MGVWRQLVGTCRPSVALVVVEAKTQERRSLESMTFDWPWRNSDKMRGDVNLGYSQDVEGIILGFLQSHWHSFYKGSKIRGTRGHWGHSRYQRGVNLLVKLQIQEKPCSVCRSRGTLDQLFNHSRIFRFSAGKGWHAPSRLDGLLPQVGEFWYIELLLISEGRGEQEIERATVTGLL